MASDYKSEDDVAEPAFPTSPLTLRYAVIASGNEWRVLSGRAQIGRFPSRASALVVAVGLTKQALAAGHMAELLAQQEGGDFSLHPMFSAEF